MFFCYFPPLFSILGRQQTPLELNIGRIAAVPQFPHQKRRLGCGWGGLEGPMKTFGGGEGKEIGIVPPPYLQLFLASDFVLYIMKAD